MTRRRMNPNQNNDPAAFQSNDGSSTPEANSTPNGNGGTSPSAGTNGANGRPGGSNNARRRGRPRGRQNQNGNNPNARQPAQNSQDSQRNSRPRRAPRQGQESQQQSTRPNRGPKPVQENGQQSSQPRRASQKGQQKGQPASKPRQSTRGNQNGRKRQDRGQNNSSWNNRENNFYVPSVPRQAHGGIKARGEFGKNWWAKRWLLAMERLMDGARLQRGRRYARMGQVLSMNEAEGGITARVQGSRPAPYKVTIRIESFTDEQWEKVFDVLAVQALYTAQLLAGEMPPTIEDAFSAAGVSLFPARGGDLMTECSCPDWANPCKHIAATHYILGDRFDEDPFLILRMRGRTQEQILQALRQRRAGQAEVEEELPPEPEAVKPLEEEDLMHFWEIAPGLENFSVNVQRPPIPLPMLKRLGEPDFARQHPLEEHLGPAYEAASQAALILAYSDIAAPPAENGSESS